MKKGISVTLDIEFEYDEKTMGNICAADRFPLLAKALDKEGWIITDIETYDA